jgi:hypothetical protein
MARRWAVNTIMIIDAGDCSYNCQLDHCESESVDAPVAKAVPSSSACSNEGTCEMHGLYCLNIWPNGSSCGS